MRVAYVDGILMEYDDSTVFEIQEWLFSDQSYETRQVISGALATAICNYERLNLDVRGSKKRLIVKNGSCVTILREAFCRGHGLPDVSFSF